MNVSGAHPSSPKFKTVTFCSNVDAGPDVITFYTYPDTTPMWLTFFRKTFGNEQIKSPFAEKINSKPSESVGVILYLTSL